MPTGGDVSPNQGKTGIAGQIESSADYYAPKVYSLLSFFSSLYTGADATSREFIPVTGAKPNPKLFVVGLIPPPANISGRLLDRSASVGSIQGSPQELDFGSPPAGGVAVNPSGSPNSKIISAPGYQINAIGGPSDGGSQWSDGGVCPSGTVVLVENEGGVGGNRGFSKPPEAGACTGGNSIQQLWKLYHDTYVQMFGSEPTPTELQILVAHSLLEGGASAPSNNFGGVGNYSSPNPPTLAGKGAVGTWGVTRNVRQPDGSVKQVTSYYNSYPDAQTGAADFLRSASNSNTRAAAQNGDVLGYVTSLAAKSYYGESAADYYKAILNRLAKVAAALPQFGLDPGTGLPKSAPTSCAFSETQSQYAKRTKGTEGSSKYRFGANAPYDTDCPLMPNQDQQVQPNWQGQGSANASSSQQQTAKTSDANLNRTELGQRFMAAQQAEIRATVAALETMKNTPPLRLLVNPSSFKVNSEKVINDGNWTRNGPIVEHWGDGLDKLDASGKIAAFYAIDANDPNPEGEGNSPGLTRVARNYSASYHNFLSLWLLYRNNGGLYTTNLDGTPFSRLSMMGSIYIYYDNTIYIGSFDNFNITESDTAPYTLEYNFQFTIRATFTLDVPSDYDYGARQIFFGNPAAQSSEDALVNQINNNGQVAMPPQFNNIEDLLNSKSQTDQAIINLLNKGRR